MDIRVLLAKYLTCIIATIVFAQANITIKENTTWSNDLTLSESVNILAGATLTINKGVNISIEFVDLDNDDIGDIEISVAGAIHVVGTQEEVVSIKPVHNSSNKNHWRGIAIHESQDISRIEFLNISNAGKGLDIKSKLSARGLVIKNSGQAGITIETSRSDSIDLNDIEIISSDGAGMLIDKGNVFIDWCYIHRGMSDGFINNKSGLVEVKNTKAIKNKGNGIINYGNMVGYNLSVRGNRHGIAVLSGLAVLTDLNIINNRSNGLLIGGSSNTNIENATIRSNQGYGLELTDWGQEDYYSDWIKVQSPSVSISKSNFIDNYKTRALDEYKYDNIWEDWDGVQYTGDGWVDNWEEKIYREVPFGTIAWIGFKYNSNNGGSEFLWQPCTGKSVWSPIFEIKNSRGQALTYLSAPFQCSWNPLAGKNSNTWVKYGEYAGVIDSTDKYSDWNINKKDLIASNKYQLKQYFNHSYIPGQDSGFVVKPEIVDFSLSFYHGGYEISSYSENDNIDIINNFWGSDIESSSLVNPFGNADINLSEKRISIVDEGQSSIENKKYIEILSPKEGLAYQEIKILNINWETTGWIPMVDIHLSVDNGENWEKIGSDLKNKGEYDWWNNLIVGEKFYIKITDAYDESISTTIGPCDVIENTTPVMAISTQNLNFITGKNEIDFSIKNIGGGILNWSLEVDKPWLNLSRYSGSTKKESKIVAKVKRTGFVSGKYNGKVLVKSNSESMKIDARMVVATPSLYIDTKYLNFDSTKSIQSFNIKNYGGGKLKWEIEPSLPWIIVSPDGGSLRTGITVSLKLDRSRLKKGLNEATLKLKTNVGERIIDVSAYRTNSFVDDTVKVEFSPWHWMYNYSVY